MEKSQDMGSWTIVDNAADDSYTPASIQVGYYLRATATYNDSFGNGKTAQAVSANKVRAVPSSTVTYTFPAGSDARNVTENSPAGTNVGAPVAINSGSDVLTYSLGGTDAAAFEIDRATGQIKVGPRTILDADVDEPTYTVMVSAAKASDAASEAVTQAVEITVTNLNEAPMVTGGVTMIKNHMEYDASPMDDGALADEDPSKVVDTYMASDTETTDAADIDWTLQGADASKFDISTAGALTFKDAPNYEMPADAGRNNVYNVTVVATDDGVVNGRNKMAATRAVSIMVTNVEEAGTVTLSAQQPYVGVPLTASVTDLDGPTTDVTWKWERDPMLNTADDEEVIAGATSATYTPTSDDAGSFLRAIATYTDPQGKDTSDKTSVAVVVVRTDNAPKFGGTESGKRFIAENLLARAPVVADSDGINAVVANDPVQATDAEMAQLLTYRLSGTDAGSFTITSDASTAARGGQIAAKAKLDYETKSTYRVTVTATDPDNISASIDVTITVINANEIPEVTGDAEKDYPENGTGPVTTLTATDPEGGTIYLSLLPTGGTLPTGIDVTDVVDVDDFSISAQGVLTFNISPDYDSSDDNVYNIVVVASDDALGAGTTDNPTGMAYKKVVVTVTDVDEPGIVTLSSLQPQVDVALTVSVTDPDATTLQIEAATWKWEKSRSRTSGWTTIGGAAEDSRTHRMLLLPSSAPTYGRRRPTRTADDNDKIAAGSVGQEGAGGAYFHVTKPRTRSPTTPAREELTENSPAGTNVGDPVEANDSR